MGVTMTHWYTVSVRSLPISVQHYIYYKNNSTIDINENELNIPLNKYYYIHSSELSQILLAIRRLRASQ